MSMKSYNKTLTFLSMLFTAFTVSAKDVNFEICTNRLHAVGGMSKTDAIYLCYNKVAQEILDCQNKKFLVDFQNPNQAFESCKNFPETTYQNSDSFYRGSFEAAPPKDGRKTVCSITVNSTEEREAFRKELPSNEYSWVELLPFNLPENADRFMVRDNQWLKRACEKKIRCDVMVFSGHFASSFIGSSGYEVKLEDLTKFSCDNSCKDLFESVKQVYLFGCNTLATNAADSRTISQYREILIEDGVAPHEAQRIAARRYTTYGQTISEEFRKVFPKIDQLFGYASPGPTGKNIKPTLTKYLKNLAQIPESDKVALNQNFQNTLGKTGMKAVSGLPRDAMTCANDSNLVRKTSLKNYAGLAAYIKSYALTLPVAAVDLVSEAKNKKFITEEEKNILLSSIVKSYDKTAMNVKRHLLCPILATDSSGMLPKELRCLETLGRPGAAGSWAKAMP